MKEARIRIGLIHDEGRRNVVVVVVVEDDDCVCYGGTIESTDRSQKALFVKFCGINAKEIKEKKKMSEKEMVCLMWNCLCL